MPTTLYLYRVDANDDDGDPLDYGVLRATSREEAERLIAEELSALGFDPDYRATGLPVILHALTDDGAVGVLPSASRDEIVLDLVDHDDAGED